MCNLHTDLLQDYIDNTLNALEETVLEEHLRTCRECRQELNRLKLLDWNMKRFYGETVALPEELALLRSKVLEQCFSEFSREQGTEKKDFTIKGVLALQFTVLHNSFKFVSLMPGFSGKKKTKPPVTKKTSLLAKIIGL